MAEIKRNRIIRPSTRNESSKSYKVTTRNVTSDDILIVNVSHESKPFKKSFRFKGRDVANRKSISFRVNDHGSGFDITWSGASPINTRAFSLENRLSSKQSPSVKLKSKGQPTKSLTQFSKTLINEKHFRNLSSISELNKMVKGVYCIRIKDASSLPTPFNTLLKERKHNIIYIGIAKQDLRKRLKQELHAKGHGTFFRSIGAILGFRPPKGSLMTMKNKRNYKFSKADQEQIIRWANQNLTVNWAETNYNLEKIETKLIEQYLPLLNISKNPASLKELSELRSLCVQIANNQ